MGIRTLIERWPVYRQVTGADRLGRGAAARSRASEAITPRTQTADKVAKSVCPYCAVPAPTWEQPAPVAGSSHLGARP